MDEGFDDSVDSGADVPVSDSVDVSIDVEPFVDTSVEDAVSMDSLSEAEPPISEAELVELQNEAEASVEPLDEGGNFEESPYEPSALHNILTAGASGAVSPSEGAQLGAAVLGKPGTEDVMAQGLQAAWNMGVTGSEEFMGAAIRQHGRGPAAEYQDMLINQAIIDGASGDTEGE